MRSRDGRSRRDRFANLAPPQDEPWIWFSRSMLESVAWSAMPLSSRRLVDRLILEHMAHAGTMNGELVVTYDDLVSFGIRRASIRKAIDVAEALGFVDVTLRGRRSTGGYRFPSQYALTWLGQSDRTPPSNGWKHVRHDGAKLIARYGERIPP